MQTPAKPILKSAEKETPLPRKSVRFSLRPGGNAITPVTPVTTSVTSVTPVTPDQTHIHVITPIPKEPSHVMVKTESSNEVITSDIVNQSDTGKTFWN